MSSHFRGLSDHDVTVSRQKHGTNTLTPPPSRSWVKMLMSKFNDPIIKVLLGVTVLSILIALVPIYTEGISLAECEFQESLGIIFAVLLATGIGFWFELDANRRFETLNQNKSDRKVKVYRNGQMIEVEETEIVVGDIIWVEAGDEIPADGRLLESLSLNVNESRLTGEASCMKSVRAEDRDAEATYDTAMVFKGSTVIEGSAVVEIEHIGDQTEYGRIAKQATELTEESTPLNRQLEVLAKKIGRYGYMVAALIFIVLLAKDIISGSISSISDTHSIHQILQRFMIAVTIVVVSVPEGLPMSVTLSLALSVRRMLIDNNLVRRMHACETMGAATVICTDKTGTLTQNRMHVEAFWPETSRLDWPAIGDAIANNSTAHIHSDNGQFTGVGNPTEIALLQWLAQHEMNENKLRENCTISDRVAFSTENKFMMTCGQINGSSLLWIKGAPEKVIERCSKLKTLDGLEPLDQYRHELNQQLLTWQNQAMRTLAIGVKSQSSGMVDLLAEDFTLLGIVAIMDPIRDDVSHAVQSCLSAGIQVKIVTGDTIGTAREIARRIGIWTDQDSDKHWITGPDFAQLNDEQVLSRIKDLKIMCRARPSDKQRLVRLLQSSGEIVAVTGDGTNDAPALNRADVGLSMGTGTSVAKEASDITLLDDSFHSIASAVKWGRSLYQNIQRFVVFQLTINILALLIVFFGALFGHEIPLTVTQMLWVNLIMDSFASAALASLPPNDAVMKLKPRNNNDFIVTPPMKRFIIACSLCFFVALLSLFIWWLDDNGTMTPYRLSLFFTIFVFIQFWNLFNAKAFFSQQSAFFNIRKSTGFWLIALTILVGQFLIVTYGGKMFRTCPLDWADWFWALLGTSSVLWIGEGIRWFNRYKLRHNTPS